MITTKHEAVIAIRRIQSGYFKRDLPEEVIGNVAKKVWNDPTFKYGMEYGAIAALIQAFDLTVEDLKNG